MRSRLPDAYLEYAAEVLRTGSDESANIDNEFLLEHGLDWIKWKTAVIQDPLDVVRCHRLVNHFLILAPHADCQLTIDTSYIHYHIISYHIISYHLDLLR